MPGIITSNEIWCLPYSMAHASSILLCTLTALLPSTQTHTEPLIPREAARLFCHICLMPSFIGSLFRGHSVSKTFQLSLKNHLWFAKSSKQHVSLEPLCVTLQISNVVKACSGAKFGVKLYFNGSDKIKVTFYRNDHYLKGSLNQYSSYWSISFVFCLRPAVTSQMVRIRPCMLVSFSIV